MAQLPLLSLLLMNMVWKPSLKADVFTGIASSLISAPAVTGTLVALPKPGSVSTKYSSLFTLAEGIMSLKNNHLFVIDQLPALSFERINIL